MKSYYTCIKGFANTPDTNIKHLGSEQAFVDLTNILQMLVLCGG